MAPDGAPAKGEAGFSLIEVMAALGILSIALVALVDLTGEQTRMAAMLEERTLASVVAENRLVEVQLQPAIGPGVQTGVSEMAGRDWSWSQEIRQTDADGLWRVRITVRRSADGPALAEVEGFRRIME